MSRNLMVIFNIEDEDDICEAFMPYWRRSGCDLLFSSPLDSCSKLDFVDHVYFGKKMTGRSDDWWWYQSRVLDTFKHCLTLDYDGFVFTQYDSVCLGKLPTIGPMDSIHHVFGAGLFGHQGFTAKVLLHPPWCFGIERLRQFVQAALCEPIQSERGVMDRWLSWIVEKYSIPWERCPWSWSNNSIDKPALIQECRAAIAKGALFIHGCKNIKQLETVYP